MEVRTRERAASRTPDQVGGDTSGHSRLDRPSPGVCHHCGASVGPEYEICPHCGGKLVDYCTFCGAPMRPEDQDCPECGMPAEGLVCPSCGTRNFRPFCRKCGIPLSRAARAAVERAKADPKVQEAARALVRIAELEAELAGSLPEDGEPAEPTEGAKRLRELMANVGFTPAEAPKATGRKMGRSREEVLAEYDKAVEDANKILEEMLPPAGMTPQEQRNYHTARKVAMMEVTEHRWYAIEVQKRMGWECNRCHVLHNDPSECCVREFGGKWVTMSHTEVVPEGTPGAVEYVNRTEHKVYKREE